MKFIYENGNLSFSQGCCEKKEECINQNKNCSPIEKADEKNKEIKISSLIEIKESDINLKFIFDYIRNCGISAAVSGYGVWIFQGKVGSISPWDFLNGVYTIIFILAGLILLTLNVIQGIVAIGKYTKFSFTYYLLAIPLFLLSVAIHIAAFIVVIK